jgi:hypothetical protein
VNPVFGDGESLFSVAGEQDTATKTVKATNAGVLARRSIDDPSRGICMDAGDGTSTTLQCTLGYAR